MSVRFDVAGVVDGNAAGVGWGDLEGLYGDPFAVARVMGNVELGWDEDHVGCPVAASLRTPELALATILWSFDQAGEPPLVTMRRGDLPAAPWGNVRGRVY